MNKLYPPDFWKKVVDAAKAANINEPLVMLLLHMSSTHARTVAQSLPPKSGQIGASTNDPTGCNTVVVNRDDACNLLRQHAGNGGAVTAASLEGQDWFDFQIVALLPDRIGLIGIKDGNQEAVCVIGYESKVAMPLALDSQPADAALPKDGDPVVHCGHFDADSRHVFKSDLMFSRPDGSMGKALWMVLCDDCMRSAGNDPDKVGIRGDSTWNTNNSTIIPGTRARGAVYDVTSVTFEDQRLWESITSHFAKHYIKCDPLVAGVFGMAVPGWVTDEEFLEFVKSCPVPLRLPEGGEQKKT